MYSRFNFWWWWKLCSKPQRAFSKSPYHYITILDTNQINERKFKHKSDTECYRYGKAILTDCRIELLDSKESKYIFDSRAVQVHWTLGRECYVSNKYPSQDIRCSRSGESIFWTLATMWKAVCNDESCGMLLSSCRIWQKTSWWYKDLRTN